MHIVILKEGQPGESRVALVPAHVPALCKAGHKVSLEFGAGLAAGFTDAMYSEKGASLSHDTAQMLAEADVILAVRAAAADSSARLSGAKLKTGVVLIATMDPYQPDASWISFVERGVSAFALELIPRITRAQSMDVLSSQASLAGYKGVLLAAEHLPKIFPMMMTAAGTITPAKVFVLGAGVAGLQAVATARRLGAVVSAFDVRAAVKDQVESLGAKFIQFDVGAAEGSGGYAAELTAEQKAKQQELMSDYIAGMDVVITTAAVPGRPSPKLISEAMVQAMATGSVIVDLASERGGNCELSKPGQTTVAHGVTILAPLNLAATMPNHASQLYSKNVTTLLDLLIQKDGTLRIDVNDEIVAACLVCHQGGSINAKLAERLGLPAPKDTTQGAAS